MNIESMSAPSYSTSACFAGIAHALLPTVSITMQFVDLLGSINWHFGPFFTHSTFAFLRIFNRLSLPPFTEFQHGKGQVLLQ